MNIGSVYQCATYSVSLPRTAAYDVTAG